jgi:hypothetical protein
MIQLEAVMREHEILKDVLFPIYAVKVTPKRGDYFYLSNSFEDVRDAFDTGEPFSAHRIAGVQTYDVIVIPSQIAMIEATGD